MSQRSELARELFLQGHSCAQSVAGAYADLTGIPQRQLMAATGALGAGFAGLRYVCGAVMGAGVVLSLLMGGDDPANKREVYRRCREIAGEFARENGSYVCRELLGGYSNPEPSERTGEYYRKRPCPGCCALAGELLERQLRELNLI